MERGKCCKLLYQQARQVTEGGEPDGPGEAASSLRDSAPARAGCSPERERVPGVSGSDFSKDGREADFLIYKYQKVNVLETSHVSLQGQKSGGGFPRRSGDDQ